MDVSGKVVLITGASAGIGAATARVFAQSGAKVVLAARSADKLAALSQELGGLGQEALALTIDLRNPAEVTRMVEQSVAHFGRVDILINNAGQAASGKVDSVSLDDFRQIMELNVFSVVEAIQAVTPVMRAVGGGLIINVSSMVSRMAILGLGAYAATKAALNMLSNTARGELAPDHIKVTTVFPRMTATEFGRNSLGNQAMRQPQRGSDSQDRPAPQPATPRGDWAPQIDSAETVARRILLAAQTEVDEQMIE